MRRHGQVALALVAALCLAGCSSRPAQTSGPTQPAAVRTSAKGEGLVLSLDLPGRQLQAGRDYDATVTLENRSTVPTSVGGTGAGGRTVFTLIVRDSSGHESTPRDPYAGSEETTPPGSIGPGPRIAWTVVKPGASFVQKIGFSIASPGAYTIWVFSPVGMPLDHLRPALRVTVR